MMKYPLMVKKNHITVIKDSYQEWFLLGPKVNLKAKSS